MKKEELEAKWRETIDGLDCEFGEKYSFDQDGVVKAINDINELKGECEEYCNSLTAPLFLDRIKACEKAIEELKNIDFNICKQLALSKVEMTLTKAECEDSIYDKENLNGLNDDDEVEIDLTNYDYDYIVANDLFAVHKLSEAFEDEVADFVSNAIFYLKDV